MAGFFGMRNWDRPGPGVEKDAPKPRGFFQFFILFGRKFWKFMGLNMLYILLSLPQIIILYFIFGYFAATVVSESLGKFSESELSWAANAIIFCFISIWVMLCGTGPTSAGFTYILRNYSEEQHAWVWSDFKDKTKKNFFQGLVVFIIDILVLLLAGVAFWFYGHFIGGLIGIFLQAFMFICFCVYIMMHWYIYPLMIGYEVKTYHLFTNSFVIIMATLPSNFGMLILLMGGLILYHMLAIVFLPILALTPTLLISFISFAWVFFAWRRIGKMVSPEEGVKKYELQD